MEHSPDHCPDIEDDPCVRLSMNVYRIIIAILAVCPLTLLIFIMNNENGCQITEIASVIWLLGWFVSRTSPLIVNFLPPPYSCKTRNRFRWCFIVNVGWGVYGMACFLIAFALILQNFSLILFLNLMTGLFDFIHITIYLFCTDSLRREMEKRRNPSPQTENSLEKSEQKFP